MLPADLILEPLSPANIAVAQTLSDQFVGQGMYPPAQLARLAPDPQQEFVLLRRSGVYIGYFYAQQLPAGQLDRWPGPDYRDVADLCTPHETIVIYRSMGLEAAWRGSGLSDAILAHYNHLYQDQRRIRLLLGFAWKQGAHVPARRLLLHNGLQYVRDLTAPWAGISTLCCPYCGSSPCRCDAQLYCKGGLTCVST
ncbi:MAG: hypothetical protein PHR21_02935 [Oscillospiraceae bacterium]|nr:hypothetical protein [Oscillospiraceae bacterium]MDD4367629.1 hypothetical protein [Oscillospiraceae bacterium]